MSRNKKRKKKGGSIKLELLTTHTEPNRAIIIDLAKVRYVLSKLAEKACGGKDRVIKTNARKGGGK